jgi:hypothetical protein
VDSNGWPVLARYQSVVHLIFIGACEELHPDEFTQIGLASRAHVNLPHCKSIDTHNFFVFLVSLATHSQIFELCVDCLVEIRMRGTLRMSNFKILSMRCIKLAETSTEAF